MPINKRLDIDSWEADFSSGECCSVVLKMKENTAEEGSGTTELWVHNTYNPSPTTPRATEGPSTLPEVAQVLQRPGDHGLLGDLTSITRHGTIEEGTATRRSGYTPRYNDAPPTRAGAARRNGDVEGKRIRIGNRPSISIPRSP